MTEKDVVSKILESYPDVFADIINGFLFSGKQLVSPDDLIPANIASQYKADNKMCPSERSVSKYWRNICINIIVCRETENQSDSYKYLPVRIFSCDSAEYGNQLKEDKDKNFNGLYHPVVTIVLYFGDKPWNYGTSLSDCLDISEELIPYVGDYRINLFDMHHVSAEDSAKFRSDFKHIVEFYAARNDDTDYIPSDAKLSHAGEIADFFRVFQNDERFITAYNEAETGSTAEKMTVEEFKKKAGLTA